MSARRIAFVCSGNICRSPIAAAFAREKFAARGIPAAIVSCGTLGINGTAAAAAGVAAMREVGIDMAGHRSQGLQVPILERADHIVVMAPRHETLIRQRCPAALPRIVRMWEFADEDLEQIADPVGRDIEAFRACRDLLDRCMDNWIDSLVPEQ